LNTFFAFCTACSVTLCSVCLYLAIKVEKKAGEQIVYTKMKVKELKTLLGKYLICVAVGDYKLFRQKIQI